MWFERLRLEQIILFELLKHPFAHSNHSIGSKSLVNLEREFPHLHYMFSHQNGNIKKNVSFKALFLCKFGQISNNAPKSLNSSIMVNFKEQNDRVTNAPAESTRVQQLYHIFTI